jgi:hypothetical protein
VRERERESTACICLVEWQDGSPVQSYSMYDIRTHYGSLLLFLFLLVSTTLIKQLKKDQHRVLFLLTASQLKYKISLKAVMSAYSLASISLLNQITGIEI